MQKRGRQDVRRARIDSVPNGRSVRTDWVQSGLAVPNESARIAPQERFLLALVVPPQAPNGQPPSGPNVPPKAKELLCERPRAA